MEFRGPQDLPSLLIPITSSEVTSITLHFSNCYIASELTLKADCNVLQGTDIKINQPRDPMGQNPGKIPNAGILLSSPWEVTVNFSFQAPICNNVQGVLPPKEAHLILGIQSFYWLGDINKADGMTDLRLQPCQRSNHKSHC